MAETEIKHPFLVLSFFNKFVDSLQMTSFGCSSDGWAIKWVKDQATSSSFPYFWRLYVLRDFNGFITKPIPNIYFRLSMETLNLNDKLWSDIFPWTTRHLTLVGSAEPEDSADYLYWLVIMEHYSGIPYSNRHVLISRKVPSNLDSNSVDGKTEKKILFHSAEKWQIYCHPRKISSKQLFSIFLQLQKRYFHEIIVKKCDSKFP